MQPPLVIDLDGTLVRSDLLIETALQFLRSKPQHAPLMLYWLFHGKSVLKHELAKASTIDVATLPYNKDVLTLIQSEQKAGRHIILATAANSLLAHQVAEHLGCFDNVMASDDRTNLSAETKRAALVERYGEKGFDYAGDSSKDIPVWAAAREAILVDTSARTEARARRHGNVGKVMHTQAESPLLWLKAMRLHQWLKNLLLLVPLFAAHLHEDPVVLALSLLGFLSFGLCASGVYILNDLLDLNDDRRHPTKQHRPFTSGLLPLQGGLVVSPLLVGASFLLAFMALPTAFAATLLAYFVLTLAYSLWLKQRMVIDVVSLATLYTIRIIAGAVMLSIVPSFWMLAFSMFLFLSLALVKRYAELHNARANGSHGKTPGRGYYPDDLPMLASLGAAAAYMAVLLLALYVNDSHTAQLYRTPELIWFACPLLLIWISRIWMLAHRGEMNEDPVLFAVHDRISLGIAAVLAGVFMAAS